MSNTMHNKTVPFMWLAFYSDGSCLPQFDLDTGKDHLFKEIDQSKVVKFGWFPIPYSLSKILGPQYYHDPNLSHFILQLKPKQRLIALRREAVHTYDYSHCLKCGFNWQWMPNRKDGEIGDSGLPHYGEKYCYSVESSAQGNLTKIFEVICPKCGAKNDLKCPDCNEWWNKVQDSAFIGVPREKWTYHIECPKCKKHKVDSVQQLGTMSVDCVFLLGWQETLPDGSNKKMIMFIKQDGSFVLSDDLDLGDVIPKE